MSTTPFKNYAANQPGTLGDRLSETATETKNRLSELGNRAVNAIDESRDATATGLKSAASAIQGTGEKTKSLTQTAADSLNSTADYVRDHNVSRMMTDLNGLVKNNPGPSLAAALAIGFLVGRAFNRDAA